MKTAEEKAEELHGIEYTVPYQRCPVCGGNGFVTITNFNRPQISVEIETKICDVCHGAKIIPMQIIDNEETEMAIKKAGKL